MAARTVRPVKRTSSTITTVAPVEREVELRGVDGRRLGAAAEVVAVEGDVELAERDVGLQQVGQQLVQPPGEERAATVDAHDGEAVVLGVLLDDLVRDAHERSAHVVPVEDDLRRCSWLLPGLTGPG